MYSSKAFTNSSGELNFSAVEQLRFHNTEYWCPINLFHKSKKNGADLAQRFAPNCAFLYYPKLNAHNEQKYLF